MIFNIDKETLPREDIEALQLRRLQDLCSRVYANVPFYRKRFDESGIKPGDIKSLADLKNLPFTEKQDLRNYYPFGLFAVPRDNIVRLHASSGTTGKAVVVGYTARDLHNWAELAGRSLSAAGVNLLSKRPAESGKAVTSAALVETYAILALLISILLILNSPFSA